VEEHVERAHGVAELEAKLRALRHPHLQWIHGQVDRVVAADGPRPTT
jgi:hypothetical protein